MYISSHKKENHNAIKLEKRHILITEMQLILEERTCESGKRTKLNQFYLPVSRKPMEPPWKASMPHEEDIAATPGCRGSTKRRQQQRKAQQTRLVEMVEQHSTND